MMGWRRRWVWLAAVLAVTLAGCPSAPRPYLERLYGSWAWRERGRRPVMVLHALLFAPISTGEACTVP